MSFLEVDDLSVADKLALLDNATKGTDMTWVHVNDDSSTPSIEEEEELLRPLDVDELLPTTPDASAATAPPLVVSASRKQNTSRLRMKEELNVLRAHAQELEQRLRKLKRGFRDMEADAESDASTADAPLMSTWEGVAQRQYAQRERAQIENARLRAALEKQLKIAHSLAKLLRKRPCFEVEEVVVPADLLCKPRLPQPATTPLQLIDAGRLLAALDVEVVAVDDVFQGIGMRDDANALLRDCRVGCDGNGRWELDLLDSALVPFTVEDAAHGTWQAVHHRMNEIGAEEMTEVSGGMDDDTVALRMHVDINLRGKIVAYSGVFVARKFVQKTRIVVGWKSAADPIGSCFDGILIRETGWIVHEPAAASVQTQRRLATRLSPLAVGNAQQQIGALLDFIMTACEQRLTATCQVMENFALESVARRSRSPTPNDVMLSSERT